MKRSGAILYFENGHVLFDNIRDQDVDLPRGHPDIWAASSVQLYPLGTELLYNDRIFRYARAGASPLTAGRLMQSPVPAANHNNMALSAAVAAGAYTVIPTLGAAAVTANQYKDGYIHGNSGVGAGHIYRVRSHPAANGSTPCAFLLYDPVRVAMTTASRVTATMNPYAHLIIHPSPATAPVVGVTPIDVPAGFFFWLQTGGPAATLADGTLVIDEPVRASDTVDGAVEAVDWDEPNVNKRPVGYAIRVNANTECALVWLTLDT